MNDETIDSISCSIFSCFLCCLVVITFLWIGIKYLPNIIVTNFVFFNCLIAVYAGANLISSLFSEGL